MAKVIADMGFEPVCCDTVQKGIKHLSTAPMPILVIAGYKFPEQTGADVARETRVRFDTPVVIMTGGLLTDEVVAACKADAYITKPFTLEAIVGLIRECALWEPSHEMAAA